MKEQNEVMTAHWEHAGITVYTALVTTSTKSTSYVIVSDDITHDKGAVVHYTQAILQHFETQHGALHKVYFYSDGCTGQFKNKFILSLLATPEIFNKNKTLPIGIFFATAHGKGPIDGIGGTVKRAVWRRVLQQKVVAKDAEKFCVVAKETCPKINVLLLKAEEVAGKRAELDA